MAHFSTPIDDRERYPILRPVNPLSIRSQRDEHMVDSPLSASAQARRDDVALIAPQPRSAAIWYFPAALEDDTLLARVRTTSSPFPRHQAAVPTDHPCVQCLEEGYAMACRRDSAAMLLRTITERMFNVSPVSSRSPINAHYSLASPSVAIANRTVTPYELSQSVVPTALVGDFEMKATDVRATQPHAPQLAPAGSDDDMPDFDALPLHDLIM